MEDYDDLSNGPDENGNLNLSYNLWKEMPDELFQYSQKITHLNISHNKLGEITTKYSSLTLLKDLNVSYNCIERLDDAIGNCIRLQNLNISNNRLSKLPSGLAKCIMLETLLCSNNRLYTIPRELGSLPALSRLELNDNDLSSMPVELAGIPTLKYLLCEGNPNLHMIPMHIRHDSKMILWCLGLQKQCKERIDAKTAVYENLENLAQEGGATLAKMLEDHESMAREVMVLEKRRPIRYINFKNKVKSTYSRCLEKLGRPSS